MGASNPGESMDPYSGTGAHSVTHKEMGQRAVSDYNERKDLIDTDTKKLTNQDYIKAQKKMKKERADLESDYQTALKEKDAVLANELKSLMEEHVMKIKERDKQHEALQIKNEALLYQALKRLKDQEQDFKRHEWEINAKIQSFEKQREELEQRLLQFQQDQRTPEPAEEGPDDDSDGNSFNTLGTPEPSEAGSENDSDDDGSGSGSDDGQSHVLHLDFQRSLSRRASNSSINSIASVASVASVASGYLLAAAGTLIGDERVVNHGLRMAGFE
ncbi:hypothetical protein SLS53_004495 [Cytospora paraplurivora]|uniref:Uncharacterized protein n=1 Tax=Cytospora paraplurivora TaxID=2898453 RepID=A0AAN9U832_9PEZI